MYLLYFSKKFNKNILFECFFYFEDIYYLYKNNQKYCILYIEIKKHLYKIFKICIT